MNHLRPLISLQHELQRGLRQESKPKHIIRRAIQMPTLKEPILRMRLDEKALTPLHKPEPDRAVNRGAEPRNPEIVVCHRQAVDPVIPHAIVLRQDDLDGVAAQLQLTTKPEHHLSQPAGLRDRRALRRDHHYEHGGTPFRTSIPGCPLRACARRPRSAAAAARDGRSSRSSPRALKWFGAFEDRLSRLP